MPWWSPSAEGRDIGNLSARARAVQGAKASTKLEAVEEGVKVREGKHGKLTTKLKTKTPDPAPEPEASAQEIFDYFMKVGADFKGQLQSCYDIRGKAVEGKVEIDIGQVFLPGTTCSVELTSKASNSKAMLLAMTAHALADNDKPMSFATMMGAYRTLAISVAAEVGFKAPEVLPEIPDGLAEVASWELEAKATANAAAGYSGEYLHVSDPAPRFYARSEVRTLLREDFARVRSGVTTKSTAKQEACRFCNANKETFGEISYDSFFGGHAGSQKIIKKLEAGILKIYTGAMKARRAPTAREQATIALAHAQIADLQPYLESFPFREYCSLKLWGHRGEASAGISATAKFEAKMEVGGASSVGESLTGVELDDDTEIETSIDEQISVGAKVGAEAKATLVEVNGSIKKTIYRYQSLTYNKGPSNAKRQLVMTQDTTITYKQAALSGLKLEVKVEGSANAYGHGVEGGVGAELQPAWAKGEYNAMSYVSGVAYWYPEGASTPTLSAAGTGYSFGQSCAIESIKALGTFNDAGEGVLKTDPATFAYCKALAARLRCDVDQLQSFLRLGGMSMCEILTYDPNVNPNAVLIEASFRATPTLAWRTTLRGKATNQLDDFRDKMIKASASTRRQSLECIRLRYRIADCASRDESKFKLGFKLLGNGAGIELSSVDRAGSEGIVDLAAVWFNTLASYNSGTKQADAYELAVPPVALLSQ